MRSYRKALLGSVIAIALTLPMGFRAHAQVAVGTTGVSPTTTSASGATASPTGGASAIVSGANASGGNIAPSYSNMGSTALASSTTSVPNYAQTTTINLAVPGQAPGYSGTLGGGATGTANGPGIGSSGIDSAGAASAGVGSTAVGSSGVGSAGTGSAGVGAAGAAGTGSVGPSGVAAITPYVDELSALGVTP